VLGLVQYLKYGHKINYFNIQVITLEHQFKRYSTYWLR